MSDADSTTESAQTQAGPEAGQQPSANKSDPAQRINGLMSLVGTRTHERDEALAQRDELRQQLELLQNDLDRDFQTEDPYADDTEHTTQEDPQPRQDERYTLREAAAILKGGLDTSLVLPDNPDRTRSAISGQGSPVGDLERIRAELDRDWAEHMTALREQAT